MITLVGKVDHPIKSRSPYANDIAELILCMKQRNYYTYDIIYINHYVLTVFPRDLGLSIMSISLGFYIPLAQINIGRELVCLSPTAFQISRGRQFPHHVRL